MAPDLGPPEEPKAPVEVGDDVRARRETVVAGPNYRSLLIATILLVTVLGASLFLAPWGARQPEAAREAPAPPEKTFLDLPVLPPSPERVDVPPGPRWWEVPADEAAPVPNEYAGWDEPPQETREAPAPPDPRQEAFRQALRSASLRKAEGGAPRASATPPEPFEELLALSRDLLPSASDLRAGLGAEPSGAASRGPASAVAASQAFGHEGAVRVEVSSPSNDLRLGAGTVIPARLETAISSDAPGPVRARVLRDILDTDHGHRVLIPAGALLLGSTASQLPAGQNRALVAFERVVWPGGRLELPGLESVDSAGQRGLSDRVNRHTASLLGRAALLAVVGAGFQLSQPERTDRLGLSSGEVVAGEAGLELHRLANQILGRGLDRRPTVEIRAGERFAVYVHRDLVFDGGLQ